MVLSSSSSSLLLLSSSSSFACSCRRRAVFGLRAPACIIQKEHFRRDTPRVGCWMCLDVPMSRVCRREAAVAAVVVVVGEYCADCCYCVFDCI